MSHMHAHELARLRRSASRRVLGKIALVLAISVSVASSTTTALASSGISRGPAAGFPSGDVTIEGHGWGPGIGMGQWGAFGYAAVEHETYKWIASHFYGATTLATKTKDPWISVSILANEDAAVAVTSESRFRFGGVKMVAGTAAKAVTSPTTGKWTISSASSCNAKAKDWRVAASGLSDPLAVPYSQKSTATASQLLAICPVGGSREPPETVRGLVRAYDYDNANTGGKALERTLNILPLEEYVADVVPSESSSGWGEVGGAGPQGEQWGFQELEAQAVAARTYALAYEAAGGWSGYADICDIDYCQSYPGIVNETALATKAAADTAGEYLVEKGAPADTQFSASTGGYTVGDGFPAVVDLGDSVCLKNTGLWTCNDEHTWTVSLHVTSVESTFPSIGTLTAVSVTSRNGLGSWGGRALTIKVTGTKGSVSESGDTFQSQFGLDSNWFQITHPKSSSPSALRRAPLLGTGTGPLPVNGWTTLRTS
jgi:SpoIID/LytB domain protein